MEAWVQRALAKWPNVPHVYGWIRLDRRGRWYLKGQQVERPKLIDMMRLNYAPDERGAWYFQNGPQRGYVELEYTPLIARSTPDGGLELHTGEQVDSIASAHLDADGSVVLQTGQGAAVLDGADLTWFLDRVAVSESMDLDTALAAALELPSGAQTPLQLMWHGQERPVVRCDHGHLPDALGFQRHPQE
ncbi:DUF2946 family protein [Abyssibacter profundi]|nr:DUF2946 family protein [Abyssibacter profundi]